MVTFLKTLGIKDEFLAVRVFCIWPEILMKDVEQELRPTVTYLMTLGLEVTEISRIICVWPELLLVSIEQQVKPFVQYLAQLGCTTLQVTAILTECPHLLGFKAQDIFGARLQCLSDELGITQAEVQAMVQKSTKFLTSTGGIKDQVECLKMKGNVSQG